MSRESQDTSPKESLSRSLASTRLPCQRTLLAYDTFVVQVGGCGPWEFAAVFWNECNGSIVECQYIDYLLVYDDSGGKNGDFCFEFGALADDLVQLGSGVVADGACCVDNAGLKCSFFLIDADFSQFDCLFLCFSLQHLYFQNGQA